MKKKIFFIFEFLFKILFKELEKMYFELLRIIDPDKNSNHSSFAESSSASLSSFNTSLSRTDTKTGNSKIKRNKNDLK